MNDIITYRDTRSMEVYTLLDLNVRNGVALVDIVVSPPLKAVTVAGYVGNVVIFDGIIITPDVQSGH